LLAVRALFVRELCPGHECSVFVFILLPRTIVLSRLLLPLLLLLLLLLLLIIIIIIIIWRVATAALYRLGIDFYLFHAV